MHLRRELNLPSEGLVLEVGGGSLPHSRSDVLVDRFLDEGGEGFAQRGRAPLVVGNRVMIQADGALMPFGDGQFAYAILSHVIEHIPVESIRQFATELQRVALAGYIEAPSILYEAIRDIPEHIWYVVCESGVVHLCRKTSVSCWQPYFDPLFDDAGFRSVVERYADLFFTGIEWHGSFRTEIHEDVGELVAMYPHDWAKKIVAEGLEYARHTQQLAQRKDFAKRMLPPLLVDIERKLVRSAIQRVGKPEGKRPVRDWRDLVVCPKCHSSLQIDLDKRRISCSRCSKEYAIRDDGIPSFI
jgi:hypothetical protein